MKIEQPGKYRLLKDYPTRGTWSMGTLPAGKVLDITQIDRDGCQVIGPDLLDWAYWEMPVEPVA